MHSVGGAPIARGGIDLKLCLWGTFRLYSQGGQRIELPSKRGMALLALLGTAPDGERTRSWLQDRLWGTRERAQAQQSLRRELSNLRIAQFPEVRDCISADRDRVRLDLARVAIDSAGQTAGAEFLEGFDLAGEEGFEDWLRQQRMQDPAGPAGLEATLAGLRTEVGTTASPAAPVGDAAARIPDPRGTAAKRSTDKRPTLAVLPFSNRGGPADDDGFGDVIAEDISNALSRSRGVSVIAYGAMPEARGKFDDLRRIGRALGAIYLMTGNVRRLGEVLRISAQLIEAKSGAILWSEKFDRPSGELIELLDDLVDDVSRHISVKLVNIELDRASKLPDIDSPWDAMKRTWALIPRKLPDELRLAVRYARRAVELAPELAQAHGNLGMVLGVLYQRLGSRDPELLREALLRCDHAVKFAPTNATVLTFASLVHYFAQNWDHSLKLAERGAELNPHNPDMLQALAGAYTRVERYDEAVALLDRADHDAPEGWSLTISLINRCWALYGAGRIDEALGAANRILKIMPGDHTGLMLRTVFHAERGDWETAVGDMRELRRNYPEEDLELYLSTIRASRQADAVRIRNAELFEKIWTMAELPQLAAATQSRTAG